MVEVEIVEVTEVFALDPKRVGKKDAWIHYKRADGTVAMITLPAEEATETEITKRIKEAEANRAKLLGKKISI